jgi:hypothetical protein
MRELVTQGRAFDSATCSMIAAVKSSIQPDPVWLMASCCMSDEEWPRCNGSRSS